MTYLVLRKRLGWYLQVLDPPGPLNDFSVMADWVELSVATATPSEIDRMSVGETLDAAGLMGMQDGGLPPGDLNWMDEDVFSAEDESDRYTELLWEELQRRSAVLRDAYPFYLDGSSIRMRVGNWRAVPAYMLLLLLDHGRRYGNVDVGMAPNSSQARLLEKVVEAAAPGIFFGSSQRFGWPREPDWPKGIIERLETFADRIGLSLEANLADKTTPDDKDKGLDVAASLDLGGGSDSTVWFLVQCACGDNWKSKVGEPSLADWDDLLVWKGRLVKTLAIPWRLESPWDINRTGRKFEAVVLERNRLMRGHPDVRLDGSIRIEVIRWCEPVIRSLPYLTPSRRG